MTWNKIILRLLKFSFIKIDCFISQAQSGHKAPEVSLGFKKNRVQILSLLFSVHA